jgi:hypothetical protein
MKNLRSTYDEVTQRRLSGFAAIAARDGGDARWKSKFFGEPDEIAPRRKKKWDVDLEFAGESGLILRLRKALGVSVKADVLAFLISLRGTHITVRLMARALHYTEAGIRGAADDLAEARLIQRTREDQPTTYAVDVSAWKRVLELPGIPEWRHWNEVFAFVAELSAWQQSAPDRRVSGYGLDALGRELLQRHWAAFARNKLSLGAPKMKEGDAFTGQFGQYVDRLMTWMLECA